VLSSGEKVLVDLFVAVFNSAYYIYKSCNFSRQISLSCLSPSIFSSYSPTEYNN